MSWGMYGECQATPTVELECALRTCRVVGLRYSIVKKTSEHGDYWNVGVETLLTTYADFFSDTRLNLKPHELPRLSFTVVGVHDEATIPHHINVGINAIFSTLANNVRHWRSIALDHPSYKTWSDGRTAR